MCLFLARRHLLVYKNMGTFQKGMYSKQKRINETFECRWQVLHFLLVAGPQLNAVVLQGSARFAQGFDCSARQVPETGEQMILANQGQNRAQASRKLAQAHAQARPSRATTCPCATTCPFWLSTRLFSELLFSEQLLFFPFLHFPQTVQPHVPMYLQLKSAPRKRRWLVLRYKKNCLSFCLDETHASEMYWIRSGPPSESTKRSNLGKDISEKNPYADFESDWTKLRKINDTFHAIWGLGWYNLAIWYLIPYTKVWKWNETAFIWGATSNFFGCLLERRVCFASWWDRFWRTDIEHEHLYAQLPNKKMTDAPFQGIVHMTPKHGPPSTSRS